MDRINPLSRDPIDRRHIIIKYNAMNMALEGTQSLLFNLGLPANEKSSFMNVDPGENASSMQRYQSIREKDKEMDSLTHNRQISDATDQIKNSPSLSNLHDKLLRQIDPEEVLAHNFATEKSKYRSKNGESPKIKIEAKDENYDKLLTENKQLKEQIGLKNKEIDEIKKLLRGESKEQDIIQQKNQQIELMKRKLHDL